MFWHRRGRGPAELEPETVPMTPMIDITFQLIIFFMLVTEMSSLQVEDLIQPPASMAKSTNEPDFVVNVMPDGRVRIAGKTFSDAALENLFEARKLVPRRARQAVLIRADRSTPFETVQKVMMIAQHHGEVTLVNFGARKE